MFKEIIQRTEFTSDIANEVFSNITCDRFERDISFKATLRALLAPRMGQGDNIHLNFTSYTYSSRDLQSVDTAEALSAVTPFDPGACSDRITIINFRHTEQESNYAWMELIKSTFVSKYDGWVQVEKVTDFFRKTFYVLCYINPHSRSVAIYTEGIDVRKMHYLQCSILAFLPWYFSPEDGLTELELELVNSLREKSANKYMDCIAKIAMQYDFRSEHIRRNLSGFEQRFDIDERDREQETLERLDRDLRNIRAQMETTYKARRESELRVLGLSEKIANASEESELMDYFIRNKNIEFDSMDNSSLTFLTHTYIEFFDEDIAERVLRNKSSYIYRPTHATRSDHQIAPEDMAMLINAVFIDRSLRMKVCAAYTMNHGYGRVDGIRRHDYGRTCDGYTPNPHIDQYGCLGSYEALINECLQNHDYIGAIEQCIASCKSLNFSDSAVMEEFMRRLYGTSRYTECVNVRCVELPDGNVVTPWDAIEFLKKDKEESSSE